MMKKIDKKDFLYYKGLGHPKRIEILNEILKYRDGITLTGLLKVIKMPLQTLNFHLHTLQTCNLIKSKKKKKNIFYYFNDIKIGL